MVRDGKGGGDKTVGKAEATAWSEQREGATLKNYPEISGDEGRREERDGGESIKVRLDLLVFAAAFTLSYNRDRSTNLVMHNQLAS